MNLAEPRWEYHVTFTRNIERTENAPVEEVAKVRIHGGNIRHLKHCCIGHPDLFQYLLAEAVNAAVIVALEELGSRDQTERHKERVRKRNAFAKAREYFLAAHPEPEPVEATPEP